MKLTAAVRATTRGSLARLVSGRRIEIAIGSFALVVAASPVTGATPAEAQPGGPAHREIPADTALSRHIAWLGGDAALAAIETHAISGRLHVMGLEGTLHAVQARDGRQRTDFDLTVVKGSQGFTPDAAWVMDGAGRVEPMGDEEARIARRELGRTFGLHFQGRDGSTMNDGGMEEKDGRSWRVISFAYPDSDRLDLLIDPEDGSCAWTRERRDGETTWHHLEDWRLVNGVRVAFRISEEHRNASENQVLTLDDVKVNAPAPADIFSPPAARRTFSIDGGERQTEWIPMSLLRGSYVSFRGVVNGTETFMILDSGAGMTVLDRGFAAAQGIATAGEVTAKGTVGESTASFAQGLTLRVGRLELHDLTGAVIDLEPIASRLGHALPVILGKEVFHGLIVDIDYPGGRLRFIDPEGYRYEGVGHRLEVHPAEDGHREIMVSVEGHEPVRVGLDTGSGAALDIFGWYAEGLGIPGDGRMHSQGLTSGVGGTATETLTTLRTVGIAGFTLPDVPAGVVESSTGAFATRRSAGNLGAGILKRFRIVFDYGHDEMWLEPGEGALTAPFERNRSGLLFDRRSGALEVLFVAPGSPADAGGWKVGERITAVNGTPVGNAYDDAIDRFGLGAEGAVVKLRMEDETERALKLARYY